jgi:hypothetical protein
MSNIHVAASLNQALSAAEMLAMVFLSSDVNNHSMWVIRLTYPSCSAAALLHFFLLRTAVPTDDVLRRTGGETLWTVCPRRFRAA